MNRKEFLRNIGFAATSMAIPGLTGLRPETSIKITDVKTYLFPKACFVKIETSTGISGWGESDGANRNLTPDYIDRVLKKYFLGKDPFDSEALWHNAYLKGIETGSSGLHPGSLAGIDNALWDLKGKILDLPTHELLGGNGLQRIQVYASYGRDRGNYNYLSPLEMAKVAAEFVQEGYKAVKARMQIRQENINPYPDDIYDCVKEIRNAVGEDIELFIDFNNGYSPANASVMIERISDDFNVSIVEEPVFQQDYDGLGQVVQDAEIPIMAGEHEYNKWMFRDLITRSNVDILNADVIKCGGITECKKVAGMAHAFGKQIMVHNAKPTLATAASIQLLASIPNGARFQEYAGKRLHQNYGHLYELFDNYFDFDNGFLTVPVAPGLGLTVNESKMEDHKLNK